MEFGGIFTHHTDADGENGITLGDQDRGEQEEIDW